MKHLHNFVFTTEGRGTAIKDLVKESLRSLQIPYTDLCCPEDANPDNLTTTELTTLVNNLVDGNATTMEPTVQTFLASGTYTPTADMVYCKIQVQGGGGGSAASRTTLAGEVSMGLPGGSGGYTEGFFSAADIGASKAVTIGAAGTGGASNGASGVAGGASFVTTLIRANGGTAGTSPAVGSLISAQGVLGASASIPGNVMTIPGKPSSISLSTLEMGGKGGDSFLGGGGNGNATGIAATAGAGYGAGGGGIFTPESSTFTAGTDGSIGIVIITEYF